MKKLAALFLTVILSLNLVACGGSAGAPQDTPYTEPTPEQEQKLEVDKNLLSVDITLPAYFWEGKDETVEEYANRMKDEGTFQEVTLNDDGSVTVKISKAEHKAMMDEMRATFDTMFPVEEFPSIKSMKVNSDVSECTLTVDKSAFENSFDGFAILGLAITTQLYHVFDGNPDATTVIHYIDEATGEEFGTYNVPEDLENIGN